MHSVTVDLGAKSAIGISTLLTKLGLYFNTYQVHS